MNTKTAGRLALVPLLTAFAATATADLLVVDGGDPDQGSAFLADDEHSLTVAATRFSLADAARVNRLEWWGIYYPNGTASPADDFTLAVYAEDAGLPGTALATVHLGDVTRTATGQTVIIWDEYVYSAAFPTLTLSPGDYFLSLGNDPAGAELWGWETTLGGLQGGGASFHPGSGTWQADSAENLAFRLSLPEPVSLALFAIGAASLAGIRRSRP